MYYFYRNIEDTCVFIGKFKIIYNLEGREKMLLEALLLGIIFGKLRGGRINRIGHLSFKIPILAYVALIIKLVTYIMITLGHEFFIQQRLILNIAYFCFLFLALFFNLHYKPVWLILIGTILNFAATTLNSGSMPIDLALLEKLELKNLLTSINSGALHYYIPLEQAKSFTIHLGRKIILPDFYPFKPILSIGDILVSLGLFFLIQTMMVSSMHRRASKTIKFDYKKGM